MTMPMPYHTQRTVEWGHWGITFMEPQPDKTRNYGLIVARVDFACGTRGPIDGTLGSPTRQQYRDMCREWMASGTLPPTAYKPEVAA